ncbi:hypothetical protein J2746_000693 [Methanolobus bombayensis]|nr:hypothetical protein [Methanolobus bombayensis]
MKSKNNYIMPGIDKSKPRGVVISGIFVGLGAISHLILGFTNQNLYILGKMANTKFTYYIYFFYALISLIIAHGIINLKKTSFYVFLIWFSWGSINETINYFSLNNFEILTDVTLCIAFIVFFYSKKSYFVN